MTKHVAVGLLGCVLAVGAVYAVGQAVSPTAKPGTSAPASRPAATQPASRPASQPASRPSSRPAGGPRVEMRIRQGEEDWGWIVLELDEEKAPITVKNFLRYVDEGFYNGTIFHRVMPNFMIQGGGFTGLTEQKTTGRHDPIQNEAKNGLRNKRGTIAMARTGQPHSATSQFFINVVDNGKLDYPSFDGWGYAVFGKVVEGMDVVDKIKNVKTSPDGRENSQPLNPPVIAVAQRVK